MKFLLEYNSYGARKEKYEVGDIVLITYWYLREDDCPRALWKEIPTVRVRIVEVISSKRVRVSYDVEGSPLYGAPESVMMKSQIISKKSSKGSDTASPSSTSAQ